MYSGDVYVCVCEWVCIGVMVMVQKSTIVHKYVCMNERENVKRDLKVELLKAKEL